LGLPRFALLEARGARRRRLEDSHPTVIRLFGIEAARSLL